MFNGLRDQRASAARKRGKLTLRAEMLETRALLTGFDLTNVALAPPTFSGPLGVQLAGLNQNTGSGYSVTSVGDTNGDGFEDYVVGAPTINTSGGLSLGNGTGNQAFLIFGSRTVSNGNIDWAAINTFYTSTNNPNNVSSADFFKFVDRTGDFGLFGNPSPNQTNPTFIASQANYTYDGLIFSASLQTNAQLGASVSALGDVNNDGFADFMIGAPGATDINGANPGTGRAYLVYGGTNLNRAVKTVDFDSPSTFGGNIITFANSVPGVATGFSSAGVADVITDGLLDIAIGAPGADYNSITDSGAVYLVSGVNIRSARTATIDVSLTGQASGGIPGIIFTGASANSQLGYSVAGQFNFDGDRTSANQQIADMVMGAPGTGASNGNAYFIYGAVNLQLQATTTNNFTSLAVSRLGDPDTTGNVAGISFVGPSSGSRAGFAVSSGGDFNGDGFGDFMIGAPLAQSSAGAVYMLQGESTNTRFFGNAVSLANIPQTLASVSFIGEAAGNLTGWSISQVGRINADDINEIAIGAPGSFNNQGQVYVLPGNPDLSGTVNLSSAQSAAVGGNVFTVSNSITPAFLGASVSGRIQGTGQQRTADSDLIGDIIIGAPGYSLANPTTPSTTTRQNAGTIFVVEGRFTPLAVPASSAITTQIIVGPPPQGPINATSPAALQIYVFSNATSTPPFRPVTDINPSTITVNGIAFPDATVAADSVDRNGDGITDAIVTITPRSNLGLVNGSQTFTISGRTTTAAGNLRWTGSTTITVTGSGGGGGGGGGAAGSSVPVGAQTRTTFIGPYGDALVPSLASLSAYESYKPIPLAVAMNQFLPAPAFTRRNRAVALGHGTNSGQIASKNNNAPDGVNTLGRRVFTRGKFHPGKPISFTHKVRVVPVTRQRQTYR